MASSIEASFADLYRSAFAETDPELKQLLLQQVQSLIDTWHCEQRTHHGIVVSDLDPPSRIRTGASGRFAGNPG